MAIDTKCAQEIEALLPSIPSSWRTQIVSALCQIKADATQANCEKVKQCETNTFLSDFTINGSSVCISYTDERGVTVQRCVDVSNILNELMLNVDAACLASDEDWQNMTFTEKFQAIVNSYCVDCSTTTTTTLAPVTYYVEVFLDSSPLDPVFGWESIANVVSANVNLLGYSAAPMVAFTKLPQLGGASFYDDYTGGAGGTQGLCGSWGDDGAGNWWVFMTITDTNQFTFDFVTVYGTTTTTTTP